MFLIIYFISVHFVIISKFIQIEVLLIEVNPVEFSIPSSATEQFIFLYLVHEHAGDSKQVPANDFMLFR